MGKMKVNDFIAKALQVEKVPTLYGWGKYMNAKDGKYLLCDCSGLIKGILWGFPSNGKYGSNGVPDMNANTIIKNCTDVSTNFNDITIGEFVHMDGHCGIYVGDGKVVESSPKWENGIQITKLSQRKWTSHGKLPWVEYTVSNPIPTPQPTPTPSVKDEWVAELQRELNKQYNAGLVVDGIKGPKTKSACPTVKKGAKGGITKLIQKRLNSVDFHIAEDGDFGTNTYNAIKVFQKNRGLVEDGIVGTNTWNYLLSGKKY